MPERWQEELKKLRKVGLDDGTWRRVEQGPSADTGSGLPPPRQRVVAGVVAFAVFLAAGTFAWKILRPTTSGRSVGGPAASALVIQTHETPGQTEPPEATFTYQDASNTIPPQGGHGWGMRGFDDIRYVLDAPVPAGTLIEIDSNADSVTFFASPCCPAGDPVALPSSAGRVEMPSTPGRYTLVTHARWADGVAEFTIFVHVVQPASPSTVPTETPAVLTFIARNAPEATLTYDDAQQDGVRTEFTWCDVSGGCVTRASDWGPDPSSSQLHSVLIPAGTPLELGDVTNYRGAFTTSDGEKISGFGGDVPGAVPGEPGRYVLELHVALEGSQAGHGNATFFFGVESMEVKTRSAAAASTPAAVSQPSDALHVSCSGDTAHVSTPVVMAQADGLHVVPDEAPADANIEIWSSGEPDWTIWSGSSGVDGEYVREVTPGDLTVVCLTSPDPTNKEMARLEEHGEHAQLVAADSGFVPYDPDCPVDTALSAGAPFEGVDPLNAEMQIRRWLRDLRSFDTIERAGYVQAGTAGRAWWRVVREGSIVADVWVSIAGGGDAMASICRGSGISVTPA